MATAMMGLARNFNLGTPKQNSSAWRKTQHQTVSCSYHAPACSPYSSGSLGAQYRTLQLQFGASIADVKKAFRQLALQYHPDVCKGSNCKVQFQNINEAYDVVMSNLREEEEAAAAADELEQDETYGQDYDMWEGDDWMMGWEGAGVRDYANPYVYTS